MCVSVFVRACLSIILFNVQCYKYVSVCLLSSRMHWYSSVVWFGMYARFIRKCFVVHATAGAGAGAADVVVYIDARVLDVLIVSVKRSFFVSILFHTVFVRTLIFI